MAGDWTGNPSVASPNTLTIMALGHTRLYKINETIIVALL